MIAQNKEQTAEYDGKEPLKGKREKFAQEIAKGDCNHTEACRKANYKDHKGLRIYANKLITNPLIKARIAYLRAELAKKWEITRESQVKQYWDVVRVCDETGDMANKNKALNSIDKLFGLAIDKSITEQSDAQKARSATERRLSKEFADWYMKRSLARPEGLQELETVDITGDNVDLEANNEV